MLAGCDREFHLEGIGLSNRPIDMKQVGKATGLKACSEFPGRQG